MGELVQSSGKGGLPRDLLCGTSGRRELCMVPYDSCHIYGIWRSRSKRCADALKPSIGVAMQAAEGGLFL